MIEINNLKQEIEQKNARLSKSENTYLMQNVDLIN